MKRITNLSTFLLVLSILFFSSCGKERVEPLPQSNQLTETPDQSLNSNVDFLVKNPDNPYEFAGEQHNAALDALAASPDFENLSSEQAYEIMGQSVRNASGLDLNIPYAEAEAAMEMVDANNPVESIASLGVESGELSESGAARMHEMKAILLDSPNPIAFGHSMLEFEASVMADNSLTERDHIILLGGAAVARYSAAYWSYAAYYDYSPWHYKLRLGHGTGLYWWWPRIHCLIIWDFCGYWWGCIYICWIGWGGIYCIAYWIPWWGCWWGCWWSWWSWWWWWCF